jgi:hypothetical protein
MIIRHFATALGLMLATSACSYHSQEQAYSTDEPVPRAVPIDIAAAGPSVLNSDNKPASARTGLNSDPNNPNGAPGGGGSGIY